MRSRAATICARSAASRTAASGRIASWPARSGNRSDGNTFASSACSTARIRRARNSRPLPGQLCARMASSVEAANPVSGAARRAFRPGNRRTASQTASSGRSASGGMTISWLCSRWNRSARKPPAAILSSIPMPAVAISRNGPPRSICIKLSCAKGRSCPMPMINNVPSPTSRAAMSTAEASTG